MATLFLIIIYLSFISLGLPDSLIGVAWPVMQPDIGASFESAGLLSMVVAGGTIVSSLASGKIIERLGTGLVTLISCIMTAGALFGFSFAPSLAWLILLAIPLGLGAGAVDSGLNHYVATHYKAHHMSWLHCFWGVGATAGPIIMSFYIASNGWRNGYTAVAFVQFGLVILLFVTLPLWKKVAALHQSSGPQTNGTDSTVGGEGQINAPDHSSIKPLKIRGVKVTLIAFLFYCGVEMTVGLWGASFLVGIKELSAETAATWVSMYYGGITVGRLITGFITLKVSNQTLIRMGQITALCGAVLLLLPLHSIFALFGLVLIGLGLAPIFPCLLHETPVRFGKEHSSRIMGYQMAVAYTGTTFLPPLFGVLASQWTIALFPVVVFLFIVAMFMGSEKVNRMIQHQ